MRAQGGASAQVMAPMRVVRDALRVCWPLLWTVILRFSRHQGSVLCGHIAYSLMLAAIPFLIFATALTGFLVGEEGAQSALAALFNGLPEHVARTLEPVLGQVLGEVIGQRRGGVLALAALGAIWAASNAVEAVRIGLDRAYDLGDTRHVALSRLISVAVVMAGFVVFAFLSVLLILAPLAFALIERWTDIRVPVEIDLLRYGVGLAVLGAALWVMHRLLPSRPMRGLRLWPGVLASVVIWAAAATGMSVYLAYVPSYTVTYGALAGVVVTLLFFYLIGVAMLAGAEVNAVLNAGPPHAASRADAAAGGNG